MKWRNMLALLAVFATLAVACTSGSSTVQSTGSVSTGPVDLTFWHGYSGAARQTLQKLVAEWNKQNPNIHVTEQFYGSTDHALEKVETAIAGGAYPDIAYLYGSWAANISTSSKVLSLNDYIQRDPTFNWDDFWPAERYAATVNGKIIGVPALVDNLGIVYNKDLFDQAGISYPTADWTWDDFRAAAQKLTDPSNQQFGWAIPADASEDTVWHWEAMLWEAGGDITNSDNTQAVFNSSQGIEALTMLGDMAAKDKSVYLDTCDCKYWDLFNGGKVGMLVTGPWDLPTLSVNYGVQIMPAFPGGTHQTISGPDNWVLFDNGPARAQAAVQFITWYTSGEQDLQSALANATLPIRQSETKLPGYQKLLNAYPGIDVFVQNEQNAVKARPVSAAYPQLSEALGQAIVSVMLGKTDAKSALDAAAQQADDALATQG